MGLRFWGVGHNVRTSRFVVIVLVVYMAACGLQKENAELLQHSPGKWRWGGVGREGREGGERFRGEPNTEGNARAEDLSSKSLTY